MTAAKSKADSRHAADRAEGSDRAIAPDLARLEALAEPGIRALDESVITNAPILADFESAAVSVLRYLHRRFGVALAMVTRIHADGWTVLYAEDHGYGVREGASLRLSDALWPFREAVSGPRIMPALEGAAHQTAPAELNLPVRAFLGAPLLHADGSLFGTLCALHPQALPAEAAGEHDLIELLGSLLTAVLRAELGATAERRRADRAQVEAMTDSLTGLYNRRAWERLLAREEERCRRHGHPATVVCVDLDHLKETNDAEGHAAGDSLLLRTAHVLNETLRPQDILARVGRDEFNVLAVETDREGGESLVARLRVALADAGIRASLGHATRGATTGLRTASEHADRLMYANKRAR